MKKLILLFLLCACSQNKYQNIKVTVPELHLEEMNATYKPFRFTKQEGESYTTDLANIDNLIYNLRLKNAEIALLKRNLELQKEHFSKVLLLTHVVHKIRNG